MDMVSPYAFRLTEYLKKEIAARPEGALAKQFMPTRAELTPAPSDMLDPIGDRVHSPCPGIVHRYPDRALYLVAASCAAYCRYCFRKEVVGRTKPLSSKERNVALDYIRAHPEIREIILTGGDPLVFSDLKLGQYLADLLDIESLRLIRIHTRAPIVDPGRVTSSFIDLCRQVQVTGRGLQIVVHCNHAEELTPEVRTALKALISQGLGLLSQSVLLKGINDCELALENLFRELTYLGIKPYYLHHLDRAPGSEHFRVSLVRGMELVRNLRGCLTGLAQPTYVIDIPGGYGKVPVNSDYIKRVGPKTYHIVDWRGQSHAYTDIE